MAKWLVPLAGIGALLYLARAIVPPFILAGVLAYLFSPLVDEAERRTRLPRLAIVAVAYVVLLGLLAAGLWLLETRLVHEARALGEAGPDLVDAAFVRLLGSETFQFLGQPLDPHILAEWTNARLNEALGNPADALNVAERALDTALKLFLILLSLFYLLLDGRRLGPYLVRFVAPGQRPHVEEVAARIHGVLGRYLRGQLYLVLLMSGVTYAALALVFHLPYALPIALATGVLEVIPLLGPILAGTIAALVAVVHGGPGLMLGVIAAYFVLRQTEDQLVMPLVVGRAVHLHPLVTIFAVLAGSAIWGVLGAVMAVPIAAAVRVTLDYAYPGPASVAGHGDAAEIDTTTHPRAPRRARA